MKNSKYKLLTALFLVERLNQIDKNRDYTLTNERISRIIENNSPQKVSREVKRRYVVKEKTLSHTEYRLTYLGKNRLLQRYPTLEYFCPSDVRDLTVVVFNVPETLRFKRDRLRLILESFGFGKINRSFYLSPYVTISEVGHFINSLALGDYTFAFMAPPASFSHLLTEANVFKFWDLIRVGELYDQAVSHWSHSKDGGRFLSRYLEALLGDPFLPNEWLPRNWPGFKALSIAKDILSSGSGIPA